MGDLFGFRVGDRIVYRRFKKPTRFGRVVRVGKRFVYVNFFSSSLGRYVIGEVMIAPELLEIVAATPTEEH